MVSSGVASTIAIPPLIPTVTLLDDNVGLSKMPESWYEGVPMPTVGYDPEWGEESFARKDLLPGIMKYFDDYGAEYFRGLDIWHVPQLSQNRIERLKTQGGI